MTPEVADSWLWRVGSAQERLFMMELFPYVHDFLWRFRALRRPARILDVGCARGAGSGLLAHVLHPNSYCQTPAVVAGLEPTPDLAPWAEEHFPELAFHVGALESWFGPPADLVICSHVIEHVSNPARFVVQLRERSQGEVIVYCPWLEPLPMMAGHISQIDPRFVQVSKPYKHTLVNSLSWTASPCLLAAYKGSLA